MDKTPKRHHSLRRLRGIRHVEELQTSNSSNSFDASSQESPLSSQFVRDSHDRTVRQDTTTTQKTQRSGFPWRKKKKSGKSSQSRTRKKNPHPVRRVFLWLCALGLAGVFLGVIFLGVLYMTTDIPSPDHVAQAQTTEVFYADGSSMGEFADQNRQIIDTKKIPDYVGQAVIASEDRTFYENSGVDLKGIARALWNNVRGRPLQGASTLSQQYVENYYLGKNRTYWGKLKEAILALKINQSQDKDEILNNYLNTIYFGRSSYGIQSAAQAYFGKDAKDLTVSESALLAGIIPAPTAWDPAVNHEKAQERWQRVLSIMATDGWIKPAERDAQEFPQTIEFIKKSSDYTGTKGYLLQHVRAELINRGGYTEDQIDTMGLRITTTIDPKKQKMAEDAVRRLPSSHAPNLRVALESIDTKTGSIIAEYSGEDYAKIQRASAWQDVAMAGSTFKPFALMAAFEQGMTPSDKISGEAPLHIGSDVINNVDHSYGSISLAEATKYSVNTAFVRLNSKVGVDATREVAIAAGYPKDTLGLKSDALVSVLGTVSPHTMTIADAFSTFATGGIRRPAHIVAKITDSTGHTLYEADTTGSRVFDAGHTAELNEVLQGVVNGGTAREAQSLGRPVAAKTGSSQENRSAQFVGYIPQMVTAVSMYQVAENGSEESITPFGGVSEVTGGTWPARIWKWYMASAVKDLEVEPFPDAKEAKEQSQPKYKTPIYDKPSFPSPRAQSEFPHTVPSLPRSEPSEEPQNNAPDQDAQNNQNDQDGLQQPGVNPNG